MLRPGCPLNFLNLNEGKTEIIVFEPLDVTCSPVLNLGHLSSCVKPVVSALKFDKQIWTVVKTIFFFERLWKGYSWFYLNEARLL